MSIETSNKLIDRAVIAAREVLEDKSRVVSYHTQLMARAMIEAAEELKERAEGRVGPMSADRKRRLDRARDVAYKVMEAKI